MYGKLTEDGPHDVHVENVRLRTFFREAFDRLFEGRLCEIFRLHNVKTVLGWEEYIPSHEKLTKSIHS